MLRAYGTGLAVLLCAGAVSSRHAEAGAAISRGQAAILGIVEGLTEYLPVSSTGHLILAGRYMGLGGPGGAGKNSAVDAFEIVIQSGAILAVLGLYRRRVTDMALGITGRNPAGLRLFGMLLLATAPAGAAGILLEKTVKGFLFHPASVAAALIAGGVAMIAFERLWGRRAPAPLTDPQALAWRHALLIGLAQCLALWPGVSRSMVTILAGMFAGMSAAAAAEFSFLLALPTLGAATAYEACRNWSGLMNAAGPDGMAIALIVSGTVAALAMRGFVRWLSNGGLWPFGLYRIAVGALVLSL